MSYTEKFLVIKTSENSWKNEEHCMYSLQHIANKPKHTPSPAKKKKKKTELHYFYTSQFLRYFQNSAKLSAF